MERNSEFSKAHDLYQKAINAEQTNAVAWYYLGNAKRNMGMTKESIEDYSKAIVLDSTFADAYANRGDAKFSLGDRGGSCMDYLKAEALGKENMDEKTKWCR
jgi:tetratricopeptide (TPR) repeat protein